MGRVQNTLCIVGILHGESTTEIDAPLQRVWALVADVERAPDWQGGMKSLIGVERDAEDRVLLADTQTGIKVRVVNAQVRFTYSPPNRLSWEQTHGDLSSVSGEWELEDLGAERTRATYRMAVDPGPLSFLLHGPIVDILRAQLAGARANELRAAVEGEV
jgi:carbon monoxide dehydrogenase subunit G